MRRGNAGMLQQQQQQSKLLKTALVGGPAGCGLLAVQELKGNWTEDAMWPAEPECILPRFPYAGFVSFDPNTHTHQKVQTNAYLF